MVDGNTILAAFGGAGLRITGARRVLSEAVAEHAGHFTAEQVLAASRRRGHPVGRATVFRSLETMAGLGLIERVDLPSGEHAYVACQPASHHHHVVCSRCGRSIEVGDIGLDPVLDRVARSTGFRIDSHRLELFGLCEQCRAGTATASV